jgi:hypothetical protein
MIVSPRPILLADVAPEEVVASFQRMDPATREALIICAALAGVITLVFLWVLFVKIPAGKKGRRRKHHHHSPSVSESRDAATDSNKSEADQGRRKWRRRRREHRPRNPTLAETGGLPPIRSEGQPPPAP